MDTHHLTLSGSAAAAAEYQGMLFMLGKLDGRILREKKPRKRERLTNRRTRQRENLACYVAARQ